MSGASALSAAKNRRSTGNIVQTTPNRNQVVSQQPPSPQQRQQQQGQSQQGQQQQNNADDLPKPSNPIQALQLHEIRLNRCDKVQQDLENSIKTMATNLDVLSKKNVSQPVNNNSNNNSNDTTKFNQLLSELNERLSTMEEMFHHLKEDIFRVQTFAMETSLSVLKISDKEKIVYVHVPVASVPIVELPATPVLATPVPATPVPATPVPATPVPATPVPATPVPATPVPVYDPFKYVPTVPEEEPTSNISLQISDFTNDTTLSLSQIVDSSQ